MDRSPTVVRGGIPEGTIRHGTSPTYSRMTGSRIEYVVILKLKRRKEDPRRKKVFGLGFRGEYRC